MVAMQAAYQRNPQHPPPSHNARHDAAPGCPEGRSLQLPTAMFPGTRASQQVAHLVKAMGYQWSFQSKEEALDTSTGESRAGGGLSTTCGMSAVVATVTRLVLPMCRPHSSGPRGAHGLRA